MQPGFRTRIENNAAVACMLLDVLTQEAGPLLQYYEAAKRHLMAVVYAPASEVTTMLEIGGSHTAGPVPRDSTAGKGAGSSGGGGGRRGVDDTSFLLLDTSRQLQPAAEGPPAAVSAPCIANLPIIQPQDLKRHYRTEQLMHIERHEKLAYGDILHPTPSPILKNFLSRITYYEQHKRTTLQYEDFGLRLQHANAALRLKSAVLHTSCRIWQIRLAGLVFRGWKLAVKLLKTRRGAVCGCKERLFRSLALVKSFGTWRTVTATCTATRQRQDARRRMAAMAKHCQKLITENNNLDDMLTEKQAKVAQANEKVTEEQQAKEQDVKRLEELGDVVASWEAAATTAIERTQALKTESALKPDLELGRRQIESVLLPWTLSVCKSTDTVVNFSTDWQDGSRFLTLLRCIPGSGFSGAAPPTAVKRVELVGQLLGGLGIDVLPRLIFDGHSDVVACALFRLWTRFGRLRSHPRSRSPAAPLSLGEEQAVFEDQLDTAVDATREWLQRRRTMHSYCMNLLVRRGQGAPMAVLTSKELADIARAVGPFTDITLDSIVPWPCSEADVTELDIDGLQTVIARHASDLSRAFLHYTGDSGTLPYQGFFRFLGDCKFLGKSFTKQQAAALFARICSHADNYFSGYTTDEVTADMSFTAAHFVLLLVHIAFSRSRDDKKMKGKKIVSVFDLVLQYDVLPNAGNPVASSFRRQLWTDDVQRVVSKHRADIYRLFKLHSKDSPAKAYTKTKASQDDPNTMSLDEFLHAVAHLGLNDDYFTPKQATSLFHNFQTDSAAAKDDSFVYGDFEDAVCAVAAYRVRSPYKPLVDKVERLLADFFAKPCEAAGPPAGKPGGGPALLAPAATETPHGGGAAPRAPRRSAARNS
ncbi:Fimbrin [Diplonema papillatum]|nr:Fimbrin [Diplonema papillatum]